MSGDNESSGYEQENPPQDDCCPICFDSFTLPCRTSCGHWFCSQCILECTRHSARTKCCKCPICGTDVTKLIPHPRVLIRPTEEERKIIDDVMNYACYDEVDVSIFLRLWILFLQAHTVPSWTELRRSYRANIERVHVEPRLPESLKRVMRVIYFLVVSLYLFCGFHVPFGVFWIIPGVEVPIVALDLFLTLDAFWHCWKDKRRQRRLEAFAAFAAAQHGD